MHIEIITTPNESLKESGFGSLNTCNRVLNAIKRIGYSVSLKVCKSKHDLDEVVKREPELVILAVKYIPVMNGDDIWLSDYFMQRGVNFTGSVRDILKFDSNKVLAKTHLIEKGIKTADYFIAIPGQFNQESDLPVSYPLFIKPLDAANGNGIDDLSFVNNFAEYESKVASLYKTFNQPVLVEHYLGGREFTVAIIESTNNRLITSAVEVIPPTSTNGLKILGAQTKKDNSEKLVVIDEQELKSKVTALAIEAYKALDIRDFGRIDIKTNKEGECFFIEANLVPGMTYGSSYFPQACYIAHKFDYDKVIELLIAPGLARVYSIILANIQPYTEKKIAAVL
ncbi:MAG: D-alanine--D-alanine ligase [Gammaproteobacteria bacterium]|nr:D-alanine--D-alanine ligase [Gammaproteobacteria bacterium]MCW8986590.1 D-alanine--D-alanine ligase [Gammaproteobacteria bacterium]